MLYRIQNGEVSFREPPEKNGWWEVWGVYKGRKVWGYAGLQDHIVGCPVNV
jgi:hypothetical protein